MGNGDNLQEMQNKQDVRTVEIKVSQEQQKENSGVAPVINKDLEKFNTNASGKKVPLFREESKSINELVGSMVLDYDKILETDEKEQKAVRVDFDKFDHMTMKEVLEAMKNDSHTKHRAFAEMEEAFKTLVNFGQFYDKAVKSGKQPIEFNDVFRIAENTARFYQVSHKKFLFGTEYGKNRYKLSCRILDIIKDLKVYIRDESSRRIKETDDKVRNARIDVIIDEKELSEKEKGDVINEWLENGAEYKDVLQKILRDEKLLDKDKQTLARIVADKNRRLVANKVTLKLVCDEKKNLTLGLSDLKSRLDKYLKSRFGSDDESKKVLFEDGDNFRIRLNGLLNDYEKENSELLRKTAVRKEKFEKELGIDGTDDRYYEKNDINDLLINAGDDVFEARLGTLKVRQNDNIAIADQFIDELGYSSFTAESIKEKIRKDLGVKLLIAGEVEIAELVKDDIRRLRFLAADEFEAESRIKHLLDVLQLPKSEKENFARFISGDGSVNGILKQKSSALRKKADTYAENLKGLKEAEKLSHNKKLTLKPATWEKLEVLKSNMGSYDKKAFKSELKKILKADKDGKLVLEQPNITFEAFNKSRTKERVRQDIGFTQRILGDLFLKDKEIQKILTREETEYFRANLIKNLCSGGRDIGELEFLPTGAIKSIAIMLKKNLVANPDFIKELRKDNKDNSGIVNEVLMKMTLSTELMSLGDLNDLVMRVSEKHMYDNRMSEEKEKLMDALRAGGSNDATLSQERYYYFLKQLDFLKKYRLGKYSLFAEKLISRNEVFSVMMNQDQNTFAVFLDSEVDKKMGKAIDAINASKMQKAFKEIYIDRKFDALYDGNLAGGILHVKEDMLSEQKKYFKEHDLDEKTVDKNISAASEAVIRKIVGKSKKNAKAMGDIYGCTEAVVSQCYGDKSKVRMLSSKMSLEDEIQKSYERFQDNKDVLDRKLKELGTNEGSIFYGYGDADIKIAAQGCKNAAAFGRAVKNRMMLTDKDSFTRELAQLLENFEKTYRSKISSKDADKPKVASPEKRQNTEIRKASIKEVRDSRDKFIGLDKVAASVEDILTRKALVTLGTGDGTSLSHDNWQKSRDYIRKEISKYYDMDPFLVDLLVEKNVNEFFGDRIEVHSKWLYNTFSILGQADEKEEKISKDEQKLLIVNAYRHMDNFEDKNIKGKFRDDRRFVKGDWYKTFRKNYKELKKLEELKLSFAPLEQERINITRQLRALLATGIGISEQDKKSKVSFSDMAKKAYGYISYVNSFMNSASAALSKDENFRKENEITRNNYLLALRQFYNDRIMGEVGEGEAGGFKEENWKAEFAEFTADKTKLSNIVRDGKEKSVSSKTYIKENRNFAEYIGRDKIDSIISREGSRGCINKYNKLSEAEKELFSLALMLMEKSAIGFDAGSVQVLANEELREKEVGPRLKELVKYMSGEEYDFKIDYSQAYYKLTNIGLSFTGEEKRAFSKSAFDKAYEFAKAVTGKMKEDNSGPATKEDKERISDGISSIYEAALLGKNRQLTEVDNLRKERFGAAQVRDKLLEYDRQDSRTEDKKGVRARVVKALKKMDNTDMLRLLAVLQNRSVLEKSAADDKKFVDEDKREELKLLFSEDNQEWAFEQFGKSGACMQALITALSFKIEDKRSLIGSTLTKKDFNSESFDRKTLVDWKLLDKALDFLKEMDKDRLVRYAMRSAPNYIEASGNEKAIEAYKKNLKGKDPGSIKKDTLEEFLKKESDKDRTSGDNEDAKLAFAGYSKLSDEQKKLFIKVLARRDFLDISKKNLYLNIFSYSKERNYANETGRYRLIDEYIENSLGGNSGVTLSENSYAEAFKSLLSTQVDDTADFGNVKHIEDVLSKEKYYIAKRDTAVDWKLFTRALQFVQRATYELEMREGNDELYRSAGDITRYGHLSMDYSILRKNIHNTGNQFLRFGAQQSKKLIADDVLDDVKIIGEKSVTDITKVAKKVVKTVVGGIMPSFNAKMDKLDEMLKVDVREKEKRVGELPSYLTTDIKDIDITEVLTDKVKDKLTGKLLTKEGSLSNDISELVLDSFKDGIEVNKIGDLIRNKLMEKPESSKEKRLDGIIGNYKVDYQFGDIRDEINDITAKYNDIKELPEKYKSKISNIPGISSVKQILNLEVASSIKEAIENKYVQTATRILFELDVKDSDIDALSDSSPVGKEVAGIIKETMEQYKKANKNVEELLQKPQEIIDKIQEKAKEVTGTIIEGAIGKEGLEYINEKTELLTGFASSMMDKVSWVIGKVNKYKEYIDGFRDIALSIKNKKLLSKADDMANSQETQEADRKMLKKSEEFENTRQKKIKNNAVSEHKDLQKMSKETANTIQNLAIAEDAIKMSIALGEEIFGKLDAGIATGLVKAAVDAGIEFAMYCIRCVKDRKMLKTYYTETDKGQKVVRDIKDSYQNLVGSKEVMEAELMNRDTLDLVCKGNGYENKDELVRDTGMKMASSIAFCASNYNPVKETRVMATTVMIVLGLKDMIGKTDASTIAGIFDKMKAA